VLRTVEEGQKKRSGGGGSSSGGGGGKSTRRAPRNYWVPSSERYGFPLHHFPRNSFFSTLSSLEAFIMVGVARDQLGWWRGW